MKLTFEHYNKAACHFRIGQYVEMWSSEMWNKDKETLFLSGSLLPSGLCLPQTFIHFPSDWISTVDWVNLAFHPQTVPLTQLFHSSAFLLLRSASQSATRFPTLFSLWLLWVASYLLLVSRSLLGYVGSTPNSLSCDYLVCFVPGCLSICPSLSIFCFSLCLLRA